MSADLKKLARISLILILIFAAAFVIRYISYKDVGITLDEPFYVKGGIYYINAAANLSFFDSAWSYNYEHPPISKYIYGIPLYLLNNQYDGNAFLISKTMSILCGCFTCVIVYLIGRKFFDDHVGVLAALILAFTPMMIAHNQLSNIDSPVTLMLTATMYVYMVAVRSRSLKLYLASAIMLGLSIGTKYNSLLIIPVMIGLYFLFRFYNDDMNVSKTLKGLLSKPPKILLIAACVAVVILTFYIIWPYLWLNPIDNILLSLAHWSSRPLPEVLLGTSITQNIPLYYYPVYFLVTTPEVLLVALPFGMFYLLKSKDPFKIAMILWLFIPFLYGFSHFIMGSMRYILMIYPALSLVCAYGIYSVSGKLAELLKGYNVKRSAISLIMSGAVIAILIFTCLSTQPLYLDYYNSLAGGYDSIKENKSFILSWWGEGVSDPVRFVESASYNATVSVIASGIINSYEYIGMYAKNNDYSLVGGMGGGMGPGVGLPGYGNFTPGSMPPEGKYGMGAFRPQGYQNGMGPGFQPPDGMFGPGDFPSADMIYRLKDFMPPGGDYGMMPGFGPANISNITTDYLIVGTGLADDDELKTSNYTLVYQSIFKGVPLYDVYKRAD